MLKRRLAAAALAGRVLGSGFRLAGLCRGLRHRHVVTGDREPDQAGQSLVAFRCRPTGASPARPTSGPSSSPGSPHPQGPGLIVAIASSLPPALTWARVSTRRFSARRTESVITVSAPAGLPRRVLAGSGGEQSPDKAGHEPAPVEPGNTTQRADLSFRSAGGQAA